MKLVISETVNDIPVVTEKENIIVISDFDTGAGAVPLSTVTGKGSLIVGTASATVDELVVGANGTSPIADNTETTGIRWGAPGGSFTASDAENRTLTGTLVLVDADAYVQYCDPGGASRDITLPAEGTGNHPFYIYNTADAAEVLTVKNAAATVIGVLNRGDAGLFVSSSATWTQDKQIVTKILRGSISNPQAVYAQAPQIVLIDSTESAITTTGIYVKLNDSTPGAELAGDMMFADDQFDGGFANPVVIGVCDTTSGVFAATTGFDDATIPSGKAVYFQMDASPHADIKRFTIKFMYTVDL